jgi:hypothetical protein
MKKANLLQCSMINQSLTELAVRTFTQSLCNIRCGVRKYVMRLKRNIIESMTSLLQREPEVKEGPRGLV